MDDLIQIKIPANPKYLKLIRKFVTSICEMARFSTRQSNQITLAIDEACTNIIRHAYGGATYQPIILLTRILPDRIRFILRDFGQKADLETIKSRQLEDVRPGGLGVHLIKSVMDTFEFRHIPNGNELVLEKLFSTSEEA